MAGDRKGKFTAGIEITVLDHTARALNEINERLKKLEPAAKRAAKAMDLSNLETLGSAAGSLIEKPIKRFADFEEQMDSVTAATFDLTKAMDAGQVDQMNLKVGELSATARQLGADTRYSATEAAAGMDILAKNFAGADMEKAQAVIDAMPGILDTAAATKQTIEATADVSTATMNQFGLAAKDMGFIGDVLVKTANTSATGLLDLGEALKYSGVTAHKAGVDLATTTAMIGALGNAGKKGSVAGTGLASVLSNVQSGAKKQRSALAALGINVQDKAGNLKPIVELLAELDKAADKKFGGKGKGGVRRDRWLQGLVGMGGDKEALAILMQQAGTGELQKLVEANKQAAGTAHLVAAAMSDNTAGAARELDSALEELQLTMGETLIPAISDTLKWVKDATVDVAAWAKENPALTEALGSLAIALGVVAAVTRVVTIAMMTNPIVAIVTGIALAAYLIYEHWEPVKAFFEENWKAITVAVGLFMPFLLPIIGAAKLVIDNWEPIRDFFTGLWDGVTSSFKTAMDWILKQIEWVGEAVEAFQVSVMSEEDAAAYAAQKAANSEAANASSALFADDLDAAGSLTKRGGLGDVGGATWQDMNAANNANYAVDQLKSALAVPEQYGPAAPSMSEWQAMADARPMGPAMLGEAQAGDESRIFDGKLMITVNSEGQVTKTSMRSEGDPNFAVRMNAGGQ